MFFIAADASLRITLLRNTIFTPSLNTFGLVKTLFWKNYFISIQIIKFLGQFKVAFRIKPQIFKKNWFDSSFHIFSVLIFKIMVKEDTHHNLGAIFSLMVDLHFQVVSFLVRAEGVLWGWVKRYFRCLIQVFFFVSEHSKVSYHL